MKRVSLILALGHERRGAVAAAIQVAGQGVRPPGALMSLVEPILPAVAEARRGNPADVLDATVKQAARLTARRLRDQPSALSPALASAALRVEAGFYDLGNAQVSILPA
jgi:carbonic anhydrase